MKIAFSPCPNDTFIFHAWVHGLLPDAPKLEITYADINITNELAIQGQELDILKISYAALPYVLDQYALLPCGGALGKGCGPLLLQKKGRKQDLLSNQRIAIPSEMSTAYLLFRLWAARNHPEGVGEIQVLPFHEIMPAIRDGVVDAGLVIHEARFTYPSYGLSQLVDLGEWWEQETQLPIPLGAIIAKRSHNLKQLTQWIQASVEYAWAHPEASQSYVANYAQEMDAKVRNEHIQLYVNSFTYHLGQMGQTAILTLLQQATAHGLLPPVNLESLQFAY